MLLGLADMTHAPNREHIVMVELLEVFTSSVDFQGGDEQVSPTLILVATFILKHSRADAGPVLPVDAW